MQVILLKDVKGQGKKDDIIDVKPGYGTNFLIKNGYAVMATKTGVQRLEKEIINRNLKERDFIQECEEIKQKLSKQTLVFKTKTSKDGRAFGSVSTKQISEQLKKQGFDIDKKKIVLDVPITSLGFYDVKINLHKKVVATVKVKLEKEI